MEDAHLLERLDDRALDAEVGEGLRERGLGLVGLLGGRERLVGRADVGVGVGLGVGPGVGPEALLGLDLGGLEVGVAQD
ncbi:hypothetical protein [Microlunatus antarcticus]|uniref:Uncharacterized protein n=1 Tax=Microlunatus antarcticus TaxID=53388 RepID=A0A7W5JWL6_9ACTN|nr:hypothetical protein [Microlunatus antarcticus]MBB3327658.1 hypothetical protein [Microlunatus antarcticus]